MADENNESGQEENGGQQQQQEQKPSQSPDSSSKPQVSPEEQARRDEQSRKDKEAGNASEDDDKEDRLSFLESREMERLQKEHVSNFLTENAKDYPDVKADDPLFKYAGNKEEIKDIATQLQNRFKTMQQDALRSVQTESDESLTDEQIAEAEEKLEKEANESGKSTFDKFIGNLGRRKKV